MADKPVRTDKITAVAELAERFRSSTATVLTEYRGLTVAQLKALRRSLGDRATYSVTKNTLAKRAAADAGIDGLEELFTGPTALAFVSGDVVDAHNLNRQFYNFADTGKYKVHALESAILAINPGANVKTVVAGPPVFVDLRYQVAPRSTPTVVVPLPSQSPVIGRSVSPA